MTIEQTVQLVQATYPQVYLACHTRHQRTRTTTHPLELSRLYAVLSTLSTLSTLSPTELDAEARGMSALADGCRRSVSVTWD